MENYYHLNNAYTTDPLPLSDLYLVQIGRLYCPKGFVIGSHVHMNWFELTIVTDGEGSIFTNNVEVPVKSGDIYLSFPADVHKIVSSAENPLKYDFFSFFTENETLHTEMENILNSFQDERSRLFSDERIKSLVGQGIAEFCDTDNLYSRELLPNIFRQIIIYLIRDFKNKAATPFSNVNQAEILCYQVMNYIDTHIFVLKNLRQLSEVINYNYSYLSTLFKKTTGRTLLDYYGSSRLKTAKSLIREGKLKISEIAEHLNYASVYAFSKAYKKKYGVPPTASRKKET